MFEFYSHWSQLHIGLIVFKLHWTKLSAKLLQCNCYFMIKMPRSCVVGFFYLH